MSENIKISGPDGLAFFRLLLAGIIAAHGWARLLAGAVEPFGSFLDAQGFPFGALIAWGITLFEIGGTPLLALGRWFVSILCAVYAFIYLMGIVLVHAAEGWFVVGLGRNGMEYSVLLVASLLLVGLNHMPIEVRTKFAPFFKDTDN